MFDSSKLPLIINKLRLTPSELERLSYIEAWSTPTGVPIADLLEGRDSKYLAFPDPTQNKPENEVVKYTEDWRNNEDLVQNLESLKEKDINPQRMLLLLKYILESRKRVEKELHLLYVELGLDSVTAQQKIDDIKKNLN